ncbi:hypothetical protein D3C76_922210 [compost metagenome]
MVLQPNQQEGDFHPPDLLLPGRKHVTVEHQPVLIDFGAIILAADHRDALNIGPERLGAVAQVEPGGAAFNAPVDFVDVTQEQ